MNVLKEKKSKNSLKLYNINGFFTIDSQTKLSRIAWAFGLIISIVVFIIGVYGLRQGAEGVIFDMFFLLIPFILFLAGLFKIFQKPGIYFNGVRITDSGFEYGILTVDLSSVDPKKSWKKTYSGEIITGNWKPTKNIINEYLRVIIFLKESSTRPKHYFFEKFIIASKANVLYKLTNAMSSREESKNNLVTVLSGHFKILGGRGGLIPYNNFIQSLKRIEDVLSTNEPIKPPSCTLNLVAKTTSCQLPLNFGLAGALIKQGLDLKSKNKFEEICNKGKLFDDDFTKRLTNFINRQGWMVTINGKMSDFIDSS